MLVIPPFAPLDDQQPVWDYTIELGPSFVASHIPVPAPEEYRLRIVYRERQDSWYLEIYDAEDTAILQGMRLPVGVVSQMLNYQLEDFPGRQLILALNEGQSDVDPTYDSLGDDAFLLHTDATEQTQELIEILEELGLTEDIDQPSLVVVH